MASDISSSMADLEALHHQEETCTGIENKKLMMWLFLTPDCMFFGTLITTHLIYREALSFGCCRGWFA